MIFLSGNGISVFLQASLHPYLGVFFSTDPEGFMDGPNLYVYVKANPLVLN